MSETVSRSWLEANQRHLAAALATVRARLERYVDRAGNAPLPGNGVQPAAANSGAELAPPPALETLCTLFGLSPFERDLILLCAGIELDSCFGPLCAAAHRDAQKTYPTFGLALAALPGAHWSALSPGAPLRHWRLIDVGVGASLTTSPLRIDERILHYLTGVQHLDERLVGYVEPVWALPELVPSHTSLADRLARAWAPGSHGLPQPAVCLCGDDPAILRGIAAAACERLGVGLCVLRAGSIPLEPRELEALIRLWQREAALNATALLVECNELDPSDSPREAAIARLVEGIGGPVAISGRERRTLPGRPVLVVEVGRPTPREQIDLWRGSLGETARGLDGRIEGLVAQFSLTAPAIYAACAEVAGREAASNAGDLGDGLWEACRAQARPRLENLAQRIEPTATWQDLVLPAAQKQILRDIAAHVRHRLTVYDTWGFAAKSQRGLGISALFTGATGTGKTMAAEVLARELRLDLFRIDLSQVVSKYIGETEKNLRRVFDAAETGGAILLFDEADALFGKRSEVKDSHDRYANVEISYLLQRMEAYRGLAILTTNMREALDPAFLRRIRFVVQFPFPDPAQRAEIWSRIFPEATPVTGLDLARLSRLNVAGGTIRNIAVYAAFLAAEEGSPVSMAHLLRAARAEYAKLERPLSESEVTGWA